MALYVDMINMQDYINPSVSATIYAETYSSLRKLQPCVALGVLFSASGYFLWLDLGMQSLPRIQPLSRRTWDDTLCGPHPSTYVARVALPGANALTSTSALVTVMRIPPHHYKEVVLEEVYWKYNSDINEEFRLEFIKPISLL
jgi:hypothetical protein